MFGRNPELANLSEHGGAIFAQHGSYAALVNLQPLMGENRESSDSPIGEWLYCSPFGSIAHVGGQNLLTS
jgi:hypothetical protein